jgi:CelD/BcsL family acetyltransferase involved in cellulose biosynthesis
MNSTAFGALSSPHKAYPAGRAMGESDIFDISKLCTWSEVEMFRQDWERLISEGISNPFATYAWHRNWYKCFAQGEALYFLVVRESGTPVAIFPFLRRVSRWRKLPVRLISLFSNNHSPWGGVVVPAREGEIGAAVWRYLEEQDDWDMIMLERIPRNGMGSIFQFQAPRLRFPTLVMEGSQYYLEHDGDLDSYVASRSANFRRNLKRTARKLETCGALSYRNYDNDELLSEGMRIFLEIDAGSWKKAGGETISRSPLLERFYQGFAEIFSSSARFWITILFAGDIAIAGTMFLRDGLQAFGLKISVVKEFQSGTMAPGWLVLAASVEESWRRGVKVVHFLSGEPSLEKWADHSNKIISTKIFHKTCSGRILTALEYAARKAGVVRDPFSFMESS